MALEWGALKVAWLSTLYSYSPYNSMADHMDINLCCATIPVWPKLAWSGTKGKTMKTKGNPAFPLNLLSSHLQTQGASASKT